MTVEQNAVAPAYDQPGGGVQYQGPRTGPEGVNPSMTEMTSDGRLIETQQNLVKELPPDEAAEVIRIAEEYEGAAGS